MKAKEIVVWFWLSLFFGFLLATIVFFTLFFGFGIQSTIPIIGAFSIGPIITIIGTVYISRIVYVTSGGKEMAKGLIGLFIMVLVITLVYLLVFSLLLRFWYILLILMIFIVCLFLTILNG